MFELPRWKNGQGTDADRELYRKAKINKNNNRGKPSERTWHDEACDIYEKAFGTRPEAPGCILKTLKEKMQKVAEDASECAKLAEDGERMWNEANAQNVCVHIFV